MNYVYDGVEWKYELAHNGNTRVNGHNCTLVECLSKCTLFHFHSSAPHCGTPVCIAGNSAFNGVNCGDMWWTQSTVNDEKNKQKIAYGLITSIVELKHVFISPNTDLAEWLGASLLLYFPVLFRPVFCFPSLFSLIFSFLSSSVVISPVLCCSLSPQLRFVLLCSDPGKGC